MTTLQGDHSGCVKPPVDFKTKVPPYYEALVLKCNATFVLKSTGGLTHSAWSPRRNSRTNVHKHPCSLLVHLCLQHAHFHAEILSPSIHARELPFMMSALEGRGSWKSGRRKGVN